MLLFFPFFFLHHCYGIFKRRVHFRFFFSFFPIIFAIFHPFLLFFFPVEALKEKRALIRWFINVIFIQWSSNIRTPSGPRKTVHISEVTMKWTYVFLLLVHAPSRALAALASLGFHVDVMYFSWTFFVQCWKSSEVSWEQPAAALNGRTGNIEQLYHLRSKISIPSILSYSRADENCKTTVVRGVFYPQFSELERISSELLRILRLTAKA